jgi:hypothetical protein
MSTVSSENQNDKQEHGTRKALQETMSIGNLTGGVLEIKNDEASAGQKDKMQEHA